MVRPERRVVLTGASPVRVSAGAPGSRLQAGGEIRPREAECQKPLKQRGANQRAATIRERNSLVIFSAERCLGGPSRSFHGEGNRQHAGPERMLDLSGVAGGGASGQSNVEQERPYLAAESGKDRAYKAGRLKSHGAGRKSERSVIPGKACSKTRWREGAFLVAMCGTESQAREALRRIGLVMNRLGLTLHPAKTRLVDLRRGKEGFVFLGCTIRKKRSIQRNPRWHFMQRWPIPKATRSSGTACERSPASGRAGKM